MKELQKEKYYDCLKHESLIGPGVARVCTDLYCSGNLWGVVVTYAYIIQQSQSCMLDMQSSKRTNATSNQLLYHLRQHLNV
jgi:hypothetical protein